MTDFRQPRPLLGIFLKILATILMIVNAAFIKLVSSRYPIGEIVFARGLAGLIPVLIWVAWRGEITAMVRTSRLGTHIVRSGVGIATSFLYFMSLGALPLPDAMAIIQSSPLFVVAFAALFLGEKVRMFRWTAVTIGFIGVFVIVSNYVGFSGGASEATAYGALLAVASAVSIGIATTTLRGISRIEPVTTIVFYFGVIASVVSLATLPFGWVMPGPLDFFFLAAVGLTAGLSQIIVTYALRYADASSIAPFDYLSIVWALIVGWMFFDQVPDAQVLVGVVIVVAAGLAVIWRERRVDPERARERPTPPVA